MKETLVYANVHTYNLDNKSKRVATNIKRVTEVVLQAATEGKFIDIVVRDPSVGIRFITYNTGGEMSSAE